MTLNTGGNPSIENKFTHLSPALQKKKKRKEIKKKKNPGGREGRPNINTTRDPQEETRSKQKLWKSDTIEENLDRLKRLTIFSEISILKENATSPTGKI